MLVERIRFSVRIKAENRQGEVVHIEIHPCARRSDVVSMIENLGRKFGWSTAYTCTEERAFDLPSEGLAERLWDKHRVRLGEFNIRPQVLVSKNIYSHTPPERA